MDFTKATRKLNHISKRVGVDILNLGYVKLSLETIELWGLGKDPAGKESLIEIEGEADQAMKEKRILMNRRVPFPPPACRLRREEDEDLDTSGLFSHHVRLY